MNLAPEAHPLMATSYFLLGMIAGVVIVLTMLGWIIARTGQGTASRGAPVRVERR